ncbi:NPS5 [Fusarium napiforme]|uniref:NPS5 n=1 Tax=Fusarium napiforme TaxID=42672 RepID=A0A8H5J6M2_9HYPO|nr:NPS5 [Fusarium napiforme]
MSYTSISRVPKSTSYAFGATIGEVFTTRVRHGTTCIASEAERLEDLIGFPNRAGVKWAVDPCTHQNDHSRRRANERDSDLWLRAAWGSDPSHLDDAWVVCPNNPDLLVPVGVVSEMLIEGPILSWHVNGSHLYRTWDPVWHNLDGSIDAVQRKDTQIKIRGQRVEAGEISSHVINTHKDIHHVYMTFVKNGRLSSHLVTLISLQGFDSTEF